MIVKNSLGVLDDLVFDLGDNPRADYIGKIYTVRSLNPSGRGGAATVGVGGPIATEVAHNTVRVWTMTPWGIATLA